MRATVPIFSGRPRKNDALFAYGASGTLPFVYTYCQESTEVVHGPSCKREKEIRLEACSNDGVLVRERRSGGGTVVLSPGVVVTVVVDHRNTNDSISGIFSRVHRGMISLLGQEYGVAVDERGISDLAIGDRKILGSSLYLPRKPFMYFYQSSLMVENDLSLISQYLSHPPREPDYRGSRTHEDFCTTLGKEGAAAKADDVARLFAGRLGNVLK